MTLPILKARLPHLLADSTTEVIVHPGMALSDITGDSFEKGTSVAQADVQFWTQPQRYAELAGLISPELATTLAQLSTNFQRCHNVPRPKHLSVNKRSSLGSV